MDEESKISIRKYRRNIEIGGIMLIIMGAWSVIRFLITFALGGEGLAGLLSVGEQDVERYKWVYIVTIALLYSFFFLVYYRIGIGAVKYARGKSESRRYVFLTVLLLILTLSFMPLYFYSDTTLENIDTTIASLLVDVITCFLLIDMIYSSSRLNKLRAGKDVDIAEI